MIKDRSFRVLVPLTCREFIRTWWNNGTLQETWVAEQRLRKI